MPRVSTCWRVSRSCLESSLPSSSSMGSSIRSRLMDVCAKLWPMVAPSFS
eukprot:CAMPEP_0172702510 /NCGR_PEP_ID=MMETSP1074-20121228/34676_1 /TAXON_ID=2916 /ORGANISM="Ceratium fusus, Strain PA161109" /LENGTH=49 /DNA_ID= /DNA_START= /DNA_END= /DNA_ORIENTATION=